VNPYLLPSIEFGPVVVQRLLERIPATYLDLATEEGRFTPREVIAHLADWEPIMRERIVTGRAHPGARIEAYDEGEMAVANGYAKSDPEAQCALFLHERKITAKLLRELTAEEWKRTVVHPERGVLTLEDLANLLLGHDLYHIEQLSASLSE